MQPVTFTNGSRIFTPSAPQLGDVNGDGVIDILDASDSTGNNITDLNGDGIIDILDVAETVSNPGGIINVPPPVITPEDPFFFPKTCPEGQELTVITHGPGIITTGCNAITNTDGIVDFPENTAEYLNTITNLLDEAICDNPKVRGFTIQYDEQGNFEGFYITDCVCPEAGVSTLEVLENIGGTLVAAKRILNAARPFVSGILSKLTSRLNTTLSLLWRTDGELVKLSEKITNKSTIISNITNQIKALDPNLPKNKFKIAQLTNRLKELESEVDVLATDYNRYAGGYSNIEAASNKLYDVIGRIRDSGIFQGTPLLEGPGSALQTLSIVYGALYLTADSIGMNFVVPKFCGRGVRLDNSCNCVPISSGSYQSSYTSIPSGYNVIESL